MSFKEIILNICAVLIGAVLYMGLNWIPIIGPLSVGIISVYISGGNFKKGFTIGLLSATFGFLAILAVISRFGVFSQLFGSSGTALMVVLLLWILFLWNLVSIFIAGIGGIFGSLISPRRFFARKIQEKEPIRIDIPKNEIASKSNIKTYIICQNCGTGNLDSTDNCISCGLKLR